MYLCKMNAGKFITIFILAIVNSLLLVHTILHHHQLETCLFSTKTCETYENTCHKTECSSENTGQRKCKDIESCLVNDFLIKRSQINKEYSNKFEPLPVTICACHTLVPKAPKLGLASKQHWLATNKYTSLLRQSFGLRAPPHFHL